MENVEATSERSTALAMSGILISRFSGFLREVVVASFFGLSPQVDAFYAAYRIPNFFRTLLGEGSLSAAYVPVLSRTIVTEGKSATIHLTQAFFSIVMVVSGVISVIGVTFSSGIVSVVAPGFSPEVHDLAAGVMRIIFPFFAFLVMAAWAMGILHTSGRFFLPSVAPVCLSGSQIAFLLLFGTYFSPDPIYALAWGVLIGGILQFLVQVPALIKEGYGIKLAWDPRLSEIKRIGLLFIPVVIALGVNQFNSLVDTFLSSFLEKGSLATLSYAARLYTFPLSLFGVSIAMVALPYLSKDSATEEGRGADHIDNVRAWWLKTLFFLLPSTAFLVVFPDEIVSLVYERGAFGSQEVVRVGGVLLLYAIGLPAFGSVKILVSGFHSLQDTRAPMNRAIITALTNIFLSVLLMQFLEVRGIALATALSAYLHVGLLASGLSRKSGAKILDPPSIKTIGRMLLGSVVMVVTGAYLWRTVMSRLAEEGRFIQLSGFLLVVLLMCGIYLAFARISGFGKLNKR
jgi:putative peptidoglycan lipid II flippase